MELLTAIYNAIMAFTNMVWSLPLLILLIGGGLWITFTCDFVQIKHFGYMMKYTFGSMTNKGTEGQISPIQAMFATLANTIGTGNIIGVGSAIAIGGPGAIFWMWIIGFAAMALKYARLYWESLPGPGTKTEIGRAAHPRIWQRPGSLWPSAGLLPASLHFPSPAALM